MTKEEAKKIIDQFKALALSTFQKKCPKQYWNLVATIRIEDTEDGFNIIIGDEEYDYAVYTNEKWISPKWGGRDNMHENWIGEALKFIAEYMAITLRGKLEEV